MTKEYIKFQVVLCSSDSFMHSWVSNFVGYDAIVIGHLSKEDAEMFWDTVASQGFRGQETLPFNVVYDICGFTAQNVPRLHYRRYTSHRIFLFIPGTHEIDEIFGTKQHHLS